jgi:hypothetical protein
MTQPTPRTHWQDGDPYLEAIAAAAWEHCEKQHGSGLIIDDPRNIAEAVAATARAAVLREAADVAERLMDKRYGPDCAYAIGGNDVATELRRMAKEARS